MDREKVIKWFELFIKEFELFIKEIHPVCTGEGVELDMFRNVLSLLKEQEAVVPVYTTNSHPFLCNGILYRCGNCHHSLIRDEDLFCPHCGKPIDWTKKAVKWE